MQAKLNESDPFLNINYIRKGKTFLSNCDKKKLLRIKNKAEFILKHRL